MTDQTVDRPECPSSLGYDGDFGRRLVEYLGGDPSPGPWFWCELGEKYPELTEPAFEFFRTARDGNPAYGIALLARYGGLDPERAVAALQELRLGDPGWAIYLFWLNVYKINCRKQDPSRFVSPHSRGSAKRRCSVL